MADKCGCGCGKNIDSSVSDYFATEGCQRRWNRRRAGLPAADADPLDAVLDSIRAAAQRRTRRESTLSGAWREVGYTVGGGQLYHAPAAPPQVARWWSYYEPLHVWYLMEADGAGTRRIYAVTDIVAREIPDAIEEHLRRRVGGHIPPIPTRYID